MMSADLDCRSLSLQLARLGEFADDGANEAMADPVASHVHHCLRCQAELAAYRKLRRAMVALAPARMGVDGQWIDDVLDSFRSPAPVYRLRSHGRRRALFGGLAAAVTAAGAGAIVVAGRLSGRVPLAG